MSDTTEPVSDRDLRTALGILADLYQKVDGKIDQCIAGLSEVRESQKVQAVTGEATLAEAKRTNGRIGALEQWKVTHTDLHLAEIREEEAAESFAAGYDKRQKQERAAIVRVLRWTWSKWPIGLLVILAGFGARVGAWFVGEGAW